MRPEPRSIQVVRSPQALVGVLAFLVLGAGTADARRSRKKHRKVADKEHKEKKAPAKDEGTPTPTAKEKDRPTKPTRPAELDFTGLNFEGRLRTPQLIYFLDRAAEELERASLERRSFIPEMVKTIDEESL